MIKRVNFQCFKQQQKSLRWFSNTNNCLFCSKSKSYIKLKHFKKQRNKNKEEIKRSKL